MDYTAQLTPQLINPITPGTGDGVVESQRPSMIRDTIQAPFTFGRSAAQAVESEQMYGFYDTTTYPNPTQVECRTLNQSVIPLSILAPDTQLYPVAQDIVVKENVPRSLSIRVGKYSPPNTAE